MLVFDTLCRIISWHDRHRNRSKMLSASSTGNNNTANLDQGVGNNNNIENSTIDDVENFEALSDLDQNAEDTNSNVNNPNDPSPDGGIYWLEYNEVVDNIIKPNILFYHNDIFTNKPPKSHISKLIKKKYGARTQKMNDQEYCNAVFKRHEFIRLNFLNNVRASVEDIMTSIAMKIGMRDGKARFTFIDIARHTLTRPSWESLCRLNYVLRGAFEYHHNWKLHFESNFMKRFNYKYMNDFKSQGKQHGCFVRIISDVISNKIRDVNSRLKKHLGISLTIRTTTSREDNMKRMSSNNKSFFGINKNVQIHSDSDAYKKFLGKTKKTIDYSFPPPASLNFQLNHNGEIEYNILEGVVFPVGSLLTVNQIVTYWIADVPTDKMNNSSLPTERITILETTTNDEDTSKNVRSENIKKTLINEVLKYNTEKEKDEEAEILNKRQKIRRMVARNFDKKVSLCFEIGCIFNQNISCI